MELVDVIKKRHSVRKYQTKDVPDELIKEIIELAKEAPSAGGLQAYKTIITREKVTHQTNAPVFIVLCADSEKSGRRYGNRGRKLYCIQDATILGAYIQLIAVDRGLSSVWIGAFREDKVSKMLNLPKGLWPKAIIALGYGI